MTELREDEEPSLSSSEEVEGTLKGGDAVGIERGVKPASAASALART
jgi:hypothetical protein